MAINSEITKRAADYLNEGLVWAATPEGWEYWDAVHTRLNELSGLDDESEGDPVTVAPDASEVCDRDAVHIFSKIEQLPSLIDTAFVWARSAEGESFWMDVVHRLERQIRFYREEQESAKKPATSGVQVSNGGQIKMTSTPTSELDSYRARLAKLRGG